VSSVKIWLAQLNPVVGDIAHNVQMVKNAQQQATLAGASLVLTPELVLSGYPPEDLLFHQGFKAQVQAAMAAWSAEDAQADVLLGCPDYTDAGLFNAAVWLSHDQCVGKHHKQALPNYQVFDEKRYFRKGQQASVIEHGGVRFGVLICEDMWEPEPAKLAHAAGAQVLLVLNASPYDVQKVAERERVASARVAQTGLPLLYVNMVGGQDELVFDGNSFVMNAQGEVTQRLKAFVADGALVELQIQGGRVSPVAAAIAPRLSSVAEVYQALVLGVRDYVTKHHFPGVVLGLSGGIDSALTLCIAVDALGASRVKAVMMPSRYTADMSRHDAKLQATTLGVQYSELSIEPMFATTLAVLNNEFAGRSADVTEENIQSRSRGILLMAISNKTGSMVLTTGNKSEMAVGYATLYGDMAGGFAPLKDCSKMMVYALAEWRNQPAVVIPTRVITRPPSAELREDQKDSDSLPPYEILDAILEAFIEEDKSVAQICALGFERAVVTRVLAMVKCNEYKRRQAPPGVRISRRAFGRDWRYPITSGYRLSDEPK
jgi:NAD+ synthase (glutamine-hydrolysing)